ncbi:MAG: DUF2628 domain-containing protein [Pseudomonadales bacterium]|nr:DUF2628 domain-containing protein [Pseudomonadales bacterium]
MTDQEKLYEALIGYKNTNFYMAYFIRADERGYAPISWNWPGLFLGMIWLLYRRNYRWGLIYFAIIPVISIIVDLVLPLGKEATSLFQLFCLILFQAVYFPLHANGIYYKWAQQELKKARQLYPAQLEKQIEYLGVNGGTNSQNIFLIVSILLMLLSFISNVPTPQV